MWFLSRWEWWSFRSGYHAALDDLQRTGLQPTTEYAKERCARRSWRRITGKSVSRKDDLY